MPVHETQADLANLPSDPGVGERVRTAGLPFTRSALAGCTRAKLAAPMAQVIALTAPAALGLFCASSHEPFHAHSGQESMAVTGRSGRSRRSGAAVCRGPTGQSIRSLHCRIKPYLESRRPLRRRWPGVNVGSALMAADARGAMSHQAGLDQHTLFVTACGLCEILR